MNLETPAGMSLSATRTESLKGFVAEIFARLGVPADAARLTAAALVAADVEGVSSHGVALVPIYVERMLAGSVAPETEPTVMHDAGSAIVLDACHILGPLSSDWTLPMVSERAREHGLACVTVRNASHFGNAAFWARQIAEGGLIGIVMGNSHPSKAPPGGVERLTGANSLAIALPSTDSHPFVVELDHGGVPADAAAAIAAMLVPGASTKGFGLAAAIDLLCGGLSGGGLGPEVGAFDGDPAQPYGCAHLFMAIEPARFGIAGLDERVARYAARIRGSRRAHGVARIYAPGDRERARRAESGDECVLAPELVARLKECGAKVGVEGPL
ncbi:MAG: Ldh family oxidoreductase [Burkholderiales bacterium]